MAPHLTPSPSGTAVFRRLTLAQYRRSLQVLLGDVPVSADLAEVHVPGQEEYASIASAQLGYAPAETVALYDTAMAATERVFADAVRRRGLLGCSPASAHDTCVRSFLRAFGRRAFRRPLRDEELDRHLSVARTAAEQLGDTWAGLRYAVAGLLMSPKFLYLEESTEAVPGQPGRRRYTGHALASRLAYALTNAPPDDKLLDAAEARGLAEARGVRAEAERLLATQDGRHALLSGFLAEHLQTDRVATLGKNAALFPRWSRRLADAMRAEATALLERTLLLRDEPFGALMTTRQALLDADLATFYGVPGPGSQPAEVTLPAASPRVGLLGTGAFLASQARFDRTSPTIRGRFVASRLLCRTVPPPPPDADSNLPAEGAETVSLRQRLEVHRRNPACAGCHAMMDPLGLVLETFDAIGARRSRDNGQIIDARGDLNGRPVDGLPALAGALAAHPALSPCLARQVFRHVAGTYDNDEQGQVLDHLARASEGRLRRLFLGLVESDLFRFAAGGQP